MNRSAMVPWMVILPTCFVTVACQPTPPPTPTHTETIIVIREPEPHPREAAELTPKPVDQEPPPASAPTPVNPPAPEPVASPEDLVTPPTRPAGGEGGLAPAEKTSPPRLTDESRKEIVGRYRISDLRLLVLVPGEPETNATNQRLRGVMEEQLAASRIRLISAKSARTARGGQQVDLPAIAAENRADLVLILSGEAVERDRLGRMISAEATTRGTLYNRAGEIVSAREIRRTGGRSASLDKALRSALQSAGDELATSMIEDVIERIGDNVVTQTVEVDRLEDYASLARVASSLRRRPGINQVRITQWDADDRSGVLAVDLQPDALNNLGIYLSSVEDVRLEVIRVGGDIRPAKEGTER